MKRTVITEQSIRDQCAHGEQKITVPRDAIVTALAAELAAKRGIAIVHGESAVAAVPPAPPSTSGGGVGITVVIGADHGGYALKKALIEFLTSLGAGVVDAGTSSEEPCDYPDFAYAVAQTVVRGQASLGIMIDGAGVGSCMVVNKVPGIRGACCSHEFTARNAREHNNANVLTLGSRVVGLEIAKGVVRTFLATPFAGGRHQTRVNKIIDVEKKYSRG
jgi:ribose 5-phosphate isomerase B